MASEGERRVGIDALIDRVATRRRWSNGNPKLAPHYPRLIRKALSLEAKAHRVRVEGPAGAQDLVLTDGGFVLAISVSYKHWEEPDYQPYSVLNLPQIERRTEVVFQYHSNARHLLDIQEILKEKMPRDPRIHDVMNFPVLICCTYAPGGEVPWSQLSLTMPSMIQSISPCTSPVRQSKYAAVVCEVLRDLARSGEVEFSFDRLLQKVATALLEDERVFDEQYMKRINACLATQRRARRLRIESHEEVNTIVLTDTGIEFFTYYGAIRPLPEGDRRLDRLNMNKLTKIIQVKAQTLEFEKLLEEIQQVFEDFRPNPMAVLTPEELVDEGFRRVALQIKEVFQEIERLGEETTQRQSVSCVASGTTAPRLRKNLAREKGPRDWSERRANSAGRTNRYARVLVAKRRTGYRANFASS
ncbi:hypothetical protein L226DRAFT_524712 [Lentinus tigrinus ALCF2SS1-7]|uniref:uncharacterized protein n=1 Tax=Lentinus tigrinus ALCF2SS1-7 TaxID=1328758 RepID=UPI0011661648|nr:hypothetical protein L226DRAFT_524712 [Lentinus tigrinus ALCF2SS1-7]